jgi:tetratricopeptide (TPR) repeat protein
VKTYRAFTENETYRSYPKLDTALFYYGYTLHSARQMTAAREVFYKLIKNHPTSKYVPEAYLVFGDYFFDAADLANAENSYKAVLKFPRSAVYWYAMYKLGWIHFNLQRFQEALETFFQVAQATRSNAPQEALNRASLKGFVVAYAGVGKPDKARPAFQRVDGKRAIEMLQLLGEIYLDQGKPDRAIALYQDLRAAEPAHPNACQWQYSIARATAYNATSPREIVICPGDVESFKAWARAGGVMVLGK